MRSTTNDTVFNSWIIDISTPETSTIIEVMFTIMGFVATAIIALMVARVEIDSTLNYGSIFIFLGLLAIISGIIGFFIIHNPKKLKRQRK